MIKVDPQRPRCMTLMHRYLPLKRLVMSKQLIRPRPQVEYTQQSLAWALAVLTRFCACAEARVQGLSKPLPLLWPYVSCASQRWFAHGSAHASELGMPMQIPIGARIDYVDRDSGGNLHMFRSRQSHSSHARSAAHKDESDTCKSMFSATAESGFCTFRAINNKTAFPFNRRPLRCLRHSSS